MLCNQCSGVGTIAAVAALATTLFRLQINIHNLFYFIFFFNAMVKEGPTSLGRTTLNHKSPSHVDGWMGNV